jgi:hypothetical protein
VEDEEMEVVVFILGNSLDQSVVDLQQTESEGSKNVQSLVAQRKF